MKNGVNSDETALYETSYLVLHCLHKYALQNMPIQIYRKFHLQKLKRFRYKNADSFRISVQNIDCGYALEPSRRDGSNEYHNLCFWSVIRKIMYTPVNPSFTI